MAHSRHEHARGWVVSEMGCERRMIRCPTHRHAKLDDLTNWQVWNYVQCSRRRSRCFSESVLPSISPFAKYAGRHTSPHNILEQRREVQVQGTASHTLPQVLSSSCTESPQRPQWITSSSVEVWLQTCCVNDSFNEIYCSPGTRGVIGLAVARALLQRFPDKSTILIERRTRPGEETR
jgi:hypothetical protein